MSRRNLHSHAADVDHYGAADLAPFPGATWHYADVATWPDHLTPAPLIDGRPFPDSRVNGPELITATLAEYAAQRGYTGTPRIAEIFRAGQWTSRHEWTGQPATIDTAERMALAGVAQVVVSWDLGTTFPGADFHVSELTGKVGIAAHGEVRPLPTEHGPELPAELEPPVPAHLETTFRGRPVNVIGFQRSATSGAPMVVARESGGYVGTYPLRSCRFPQPHADRVAIIPPTHIDMPAGRLELETIDNGETGVISLRVAGATIATGHGFRAPEYGASLLEMTDARFAGMFGAFLAHALESGDHDGWTLTDSASDWTDALTMLELDGEDL